MFTQDIITIAGENRTVGSATFSALTTQSTQVGAGDSVHICVCVCVHLSIVARIVHTVTEMCDMLSQKTLQNISNIMSFN